jgi:hypothetical protein
VIANKRVKKIHVAYLQFVEQCGVEIWNGFSALKNVDTEVDINSTC